MTVSAPAPYATLAAYLRERFGERVQKIPLDAGFTCPNRDGTLSSTGCVFCNPAGSGTGLGGKGMALKEQWEHWRARLARRYKAKLFLAYLQSYTNTYGPLSRIRDVLGQLEGLPGLAGLSLGTRPDCVDEEKLDLISAFPAREIQLELGLQTSNDATLKRINRGHDAACFARAATQASERGIKVVAHLMAGLPGEDERDFLNTIDFISALPVHGVKLHNLYICRGTTLETSLQRGEYTPLTLSGYANMAALGLARLRPGIVVHRINADPALAPGGSRDAKTGELVAPAWAGDKQAVRSAIHQTMADLDLQQGCRFLPSKQG